MLVKQGAERSERIDLRLACVLSAVAGALNAALLYVAGFLAANMTGNVSALSDHLALGHWATAGFFASIIGVFILGAALCALVVNAGLRRGWRSIYGLIIMAEALILLGVWALWQFVYDAGHSPVLVLGLSLAMGIQNAATTRISDGRVRTTHVSGMATDVGIELGIVIDSLRGKLLPDADKEALGRLRLHTATIACFLLGGILGVMIYLSIAGALLLVCAAVLMGLSGGSLLRLRRQGDT